LTRDEDVLDTWFSSALWPFSTLGWPRETPELATFYPTDVLVTGFDIIFFWVARMIMMGLKFMGDVPFREVYIHGLVRDQEGQKMSKSKGNILDPIDLIDGIDLDGLLAKRTEGLMQTHLKERIEKATRKEFPDGIPAFGADALRFTFASLATTGRDVRFDLNRVDGYHRFCNKLWNAAGYVFAQLAAGGDGADGAAAAPGGDTRAAPGDESAAPGGSDQAAPARAGAAPTVAALEPTVADRWIVSRFGRTIRTVDDSFAAYRLDLAAQALYDFTWHELCDWYLELTKPILNAADANPLQAAATRATLARVLGALLKLLHPLIPFVTEELWLELAARTGTHSDTIMIEPMPRAQDFAADDEAEREIEWIRQFVVGIRQIRGEMNISPSHALPVKLAGASPLDLERVERHRSYLGRLAALSDIEPVDSAQAVRGAATALLGAMQILVPLAGLIDIEAERERLGKQLARSESDLGKSLRKLDNQSFVANAPPDVVAKERERVADLERRAERLRSRIASLEEL
ncbi:MAG: class I tRNA ligase family protein, partial [Gammaproteobacteria bacterium]|nr:class I tRNA ligase family protein [Gammaproteobacteria bacterium]